MRKNWLIAGLLVMVTGSAVVAQTTQPSRARARRASAAATQPSGARGDGSMMIDRAREMLGDLGLSEDQKKQVAEIFDEARKEFAEMRQSLANSAPKERMDRMGEFFATFQQKVSSVLNDEQKAKFNQKVEAARERLRAAGGPEGIAERLKQNLEKLQLNEEQKTKVKSVLEDARAKMQKAREEAGGQMEVAREKTRELMGETREKLGEILSEEQKQKLREMMEGRSTDRPREQRPVASKPSVGAGAGAGGPDMMMMEGDMMDGKRGRENKAAAARRPATGPVGLAVGAAVPDVTLRKLDGSSVKLSSFKARPVVLEFGSYSSPSFRQRAAQMEQLKKEFGGRATFLVVYTAEAHPSGGWEADRNKDEKVFVAQHKSIEDRKSEATIARERLKISIPIVLDDMEDSVARAFGVQQNSLVIVKEGKVVARQEWADPHGAKRLIENVVKAGATTQPGA